MNNPSTAGSTVEICVVCGAEVDVWLRSVLTHPRRKGVDRYTFQQESAHRLFAPSGQRLPCPGRR